jgi:phosphotransferase system HPr (HPr) family protein
MTSIDVRIQDESGLHARPAATFVELANRFESRVEITNVSRGKGPVNAKSIISVLALGVRRGDDVRIAAEGDDAESAVTTLRDLILDAPTPAIET